MFRSVGSPVSWVVGRIGKLDHGQTILYEIDMLRFAQSRILPPWNDANEGDLWAYLECFLLHYRNLINFFGMAPTEPSDLSIQKPEDIWPNPKDRPTKAELDQMQATGERLKQKYDDRKTNPDTISRYLQHCTRTELVSRSGSQTR